MKKKAIIFPYSAECAPIIRNKHLLVTHDIVACMSPVGYGFQGKDVAFAYGGEEIGIIVTDNAITEVDFDDLLICESASDFDTIVMPQIEMAAALGKDIIILYDIGESYRKRVESTCVKCNVNCKVLTRRTMDASKLAENENEILHISVPVIFVASVIENTNKFDVQLGLRNYLLKEGYKVSQIGTKQYCELFGFHAVPQFMFASQLSEKDKIIWFNRICKSIELQEKPDVFIIGVPGATMVFNDIITNNFGITAFEIANAVRPDASIMCVPYEGYDVEFYKMIKESSKYKLDMQVDCFNMANKQFDAPRSRDEKRLLYITVNTKLVDNKVEELNKDAVVSVFNSFNSQSASDMYSYIVDKLSGSEFGTI